MKVQVEGYTDNVGSEQYNLTLSQQRGDAVRAYLVSQGVCRRQHHRDRLRPEQSHRRQCDGRRTSTESPGTDGGFRQRNRCSAKPALSHESTTSRSAAGCKQSTAVVRTFPEGSAATADPSALLGMTTRKVVRPGRQSLTHGRKLIMPNGAHGRSLSDFPKASESLTSALADAGWASCGIGPLESHPELGSCLA